MADPPKKIALPPKPAKPLSMRDLLIGAAVSSILARHRLSVEDLDRWEIDDFVSIYFNATKWADKMIQYTDLEASNASCGGCQIPMMLIHRDDRTEMVRCPKCGGEVVRVFQG